MPIKLCLSTVKHASQLWFAGLTKLESFVSLRRFFGTKRYHVKINIQKCVYAFAFLGIGNVSVAQGSGSGSNWFLLSAVGLGILLLLGAILSLTDNLMQVEASKNGIDTSKENFGIFPSLSNFFGPKAPKYADNEKFHGLTKGYDLKLVGAPTSNDVSDAAVTRFAIQPPDFLGISPIPKVVVNVGDEVLAGQELFFDKKKPEIKYVSPVSGEVVEINRGAKRSIAEIVILADRQTRYVQQDPPQLGVASRDEVVDFMAKSGAWSLLNQRPFDVIPEIDQVPRDIFISTFDTAPLAPDNNLLIAGREAAFQKGLDVLATLTEGKVYLGLDGRSKASPPHAAFTEATGVEKHFFAGKHPAGNVGVQIHHIKPINAGDYVWTLGVQEVAQIGQLFIDGHYDASRVIAITGAEVKEPHYVRTMQGANIGDLLKKNLKKGKNRIVSGDVFSGAATSEEGYLHFRDDQITVLEEGDKYELFGWLLPLAPRPSVSNTFPAAVMPNFKYEANTNTHGESRALVVSGLYESVTPMDLYPQHLVKAILTNDLERMEGLGIYEVSEEDLALCEFVCASKTPVQSIVRRGLNTLREQL